MTYVLSKKNIELLIYGVFLFTFTLSFNLKKEELISQENCDKYSLSKINFDEFVYDIELLKTLTREEALSNLASNNPQLSITILEKLIGYLEKKMETSFSKNKNKDTEKKELDEEIDLDDLIDKANEKEEEKKEKEEEIKSKEDIIPSKRTTSQTTELQNEISKELNKVSDSTTSKTTQPNNINKSSPLLATLETSKLQKIMKAIEKDNEKNNEKKIQNLENKIRNLFNLASIFINANKATEEDKKKEVEELKKESTQQITLLDKSKDEVSFLKDRNVNGDVWKFIGKVDSSISKTNARYQFVKIDISYENENEFVDLVLPTKDNPISIIDVYYDNLSNNNAEEDNILIKKSNAFEGESNNEFILVAYDNEVIEESTESRICVKGKKIENEEIFIRSNYIFVEKGIIKSCKTGDWKFNKIMNPLISKDGIYYKEMLDCYCTIINKYTK